MTHRKTVLRTSCRATILLLGMAVATAQASNTDDPATKAADHDEAKAREASAQADPKSRAEARGPNGAEAAAPLYVLPKVGKPRDRVGGGRRGEGATIPDIYALVPNHVAQTRSEQPVLYWYLSSNAPAEVKFELTLLDEESIDPLVDAQLTPPAKPGLQRVALADYGVRLAVGEEYEWSVAVVPDSLNRAKDVISTGWVERVQNPSALTPSSSGSAMDPAEEVRVYARSGLWYDALDAAYREFQQNPDSPGARSQFDRLLSDASLPRPEDLRVAP